MSGDLLLDSAKRPAADAIGQPEAAKRAKLDDGSANGQNVPLKVPTGGDLRIFIHTQANTPLQSAISSALSTPTLEANSRQTSTAPRLRPIRFHALANSPIESPGINTRIPQSLAVSGVTVKDIGPYASIEGYYFALQDGRCLKKDYKQAKRCTTCINKTTRSDCLFHALRVFIIRKASPVISEHTPTFFCTFISKPKALEYPSLFNRSITELEKNQLLTTSVSTLYTAIHKSLQHASSPHVIHRPQQGRSCYNCATTFFLSYWFCAECGRDVCNDCYASIGKYLPDEGGPKPATNPDAAFRVLQETARGFPASHTYSVDRVAELTKITNGRIADSSIRALLACTGSKLHGVNSLVPVTTQTKEYIATMCQEAARIRSQPIPPQPSAVSKAPSSDGAVHYRFDESPTWIDTRPMIISGLETQWEVDWSPSSFASAFARIDCEIEQTITGSVRKTKVSDFFNDYGKEIKSVEGVWRIKDWLPTRDLKTWQPDLYDDFIKMLPMPDLTRPDGALNLASHLPVDGQRSYLGPHLYCAYRSEDMDGVGTTKLHIEAMDAVNIMVHASGLNGAEGEAVWHIFSRENVGILREYCYEYLAKIISKRRHPTTAADLKRTLPNPIYWQQIYLGPTAREELAERGATCWTIRQKVGEAIVIPAGCAYQSCNLADCTKVALNFVSVESVKHISPGPPPGDMNGSPKESTGVWNGDVLQLKNMLYHTWMSLEPPPHTVVQPTHAPRSAKSTASTPISATGSTNAGSTSSAGTTASSESANLKSSQSRQPRPPLFPNPKKRKSMPEPASPTLVSATLYEQPPTSDLRSVPGSPALSSATSVSTGKPQYTSKSLSNLANATAPRAEVGSTAAATKVAAHIPLDDDMDLDLETPIISKRPLPRLRGRSPSEIEPVLRPLNTSHIRQRPASSLPEDQDAFFDELVTMLFDPKADVETGLSHSDAQEVRLKLKAIVKKIYLASVENAGLDTTDYDALLQAAEPEVIAIFDSIRNRPTPPWPISVEVKERPKQTSNPTSAAPVWTPPLNPVNGIPQHIQPSKIDPATPSGAVATSADSIQAKHSAVPTPETSTTVVPPAPMVSLPPHVPNGSEQSQPILPSAPNPVIGLPQRNQPSTSKSAMPSGGPATSSAGSQAKQPAAPAPASSTPPVPLTSTTSVPPVPVVSKQSHGTNLSQPPTPLGSATSSATFVPPLASAFPSVQRPGPSQMIRVKAPQVRSVSATEAARRSQSIDDTLQAKVINLQSGSSTPLNGNLPQSLTPVPYARPPAQSASLSTSKQLSRSVATSQRTTSNPPSPALGNPVSVTEPVYIRLPTRPRAHEERPYTTEAPPREPLRLDLEGTTQAAYWYSLYG